VSAPFPFQDNHPRFRIPGWAELLGSDECISAPEMARHFLITGETGSGKSVSAVMRLLEAILRYPEEDLYREYAEETRAARADSAEDLRPAVLVVDPKEELGEVVKREGRGRRVIEMSYGGRGPVLHLFEGRDLRKLDAFEVMDLILQHSDFFVQDQARTREPIWNLQAASILRDFVAIDLWLHRRKAGLVEALWCKLGNSLCDDDRYTSYLPSLKYDAANYFKPHGTLLNICAGEDDHFALDSYVAAATELGVPGEMTVRLLALNRLYHGTRSGVIWMVNGILADMAADEFAACVSVNPLEPPRASMRLSVADALNNGDLVVYVPKGTSPVADMVGRCLKSRFFAFAFERRNKVRPFFYVVDEAHRFLSCGEEDGEQSLLDRCRAYRTGVVLATQSIASIAYKLGQNDRNSVNALNMLLNNCGNAMYFRTPDIQTKENLTERIPLPPVSGRPHILKVRPLTSLGVGQCYALRCNGSWGLFQVHLPEEKEISEQRDEVHASGGRRGGRHPEILFLPAPGPSAP
jgi:hypothetical protein